MSSAGIGDSSYIRNINDRLNELNMDQTLKTKYTMVGGLRKRDFLQSGNTPYEIHYPELMNIVGGASFNRRMSQMARSRSALVNPTNMINPSVFMNSPIANRVRGGYSSPLMAAAGRKRKSISHPGELDFTSKRGSKVHHIKGHYVKEPVAPYQKGGKINFKKIGRSIEHVFKPIGKALSPIAKQVLPTLGSTLGSMAGESLGAIDPALIPVGQQLGSQFGRNVGTSLANKIGGKRKSKKAMTTRQQLVKQVMSQHGLSLPQASKYIKENGLY